MGKTRRRNPMAREVAKPNYRQRRIKDKRKQRLEELYYGDEVSVEDAEEDQGRREHRDREPRERD